MVGLTLQTSAKHSLRTIHCFYCKEATVQLQRRLIKHTCIRCHMLLVTYMVCFPIASLRKSVVNYWQVLQNLVVFNEM